MAIKNVLVLTQAEIGEFFGRELSTVREWAARGMPKKNKRGKFNLSEIAIWLGNEGPWKANAKSDSDELLVGTTDSPSLERYRLAKAKTAELDYEERKATLVSVEQLRGVLGRWAAIIRRMGDRLGKRHGNDAANAVNDALAECDYLVTHELGTTADNPAT